MTKRIRRISGAILAMAALTSSAEAAVKDCMNSDPQFWKTTEAQTRLYNRLVQYLSCPTDDPASGQLADQVACNYFVGKTLNDLYGISDFSNGAGKWKLANEMLDYVSSHPQTWSLLGKANSQQVLNDAAQGAANGQAVIALMRGAPGHVALILPGQPKRSSAWNLDTPNSAAFSLGNVDKAYVFCRLSYAFSDPTKVEIYWRVKP